jgi:hypothetical protein
VSTNSYLIEILSNRFVVKQLRPASALEHALTRLVVRGVEFLLVGGSVNPLCERLVLARGKRWIWRQLETSCDALSISRETDYLEVVAVRLSLVHHC